MGLYPSGKHERRNADAGAAFVRYGEHCILLMPATYLFGRSPICNFCLDEPLISRRHAVLEVKRDEAIFRDLQSANGVYVNDQRVAGSWKLKPHDVLRIGRQQLIFERDQPPHARVLELNNNPQPIGSMIVSGRPSAQAVTPTHFTALTQAEATRQTAILELVARAADPLFAAGKVVEAETLLGGHLERVLREQRSGRSVDEDTFRRAVLLSLQLTRGCKNGKWFDHAVSLLRARQAPCSEQLATELKQTLSLVPDANESALDDYAHELRHVENGTLEHLAAAQRIEEIASLARSRSVSDRR